jgi:hypothetical protein
LADEVLRKLGPLLPKRFETAVGGVEVKSVELVEKPIKEFGTVDRSAEFGLDAGGGETKIAGELVGSNGDIEPDAHDGCSAAFDEDAANLSFINEKIVGPLDDGE